MHQTLKNIAIVAHVDHGKTTMMDGLLKQSNTLDRKSQDQDRILDSGDIEKERGITIKAKNCAIHWKDRKINLIDTPGHADFGGEVERSLMMVDGCILLVDAAEGPLPQTRFVLQKALQRGIKIACVINKVDRHDARVDEVKEEAIDLLLDLATIVDREDIDLDIPFFYASAKEGRCSDEMEKYDECADLNPLLDFLASDYFPAPQIAEGPDFQLLVTNLSYDNYLGPQVIGRIHRGKVAKNQEVLLLGKDDKQKKFRVTQLEIFGGLGLEQVDSAEAGEIVQISGITGANIGDSISNTEKPEALPRISIDPPTVSVNVSVNTSPFSGQEGEYLTSRKLEEYLEDVCRHNVALQYEPTDDPKIYRLKGRGELQLAIVFEELRRRGYEFMVSRPEVLFIEEDGVKMEPFENVVIDIPEEFTGSITEAMAERKGIMGNLVKIGEDRQRLEFTVPSRGLIGLRSKFLTMTKGEGLMSSYFLDYREYLGSMLARSQGAIIADRTGKTTGYALFNLLSTGRQFVTVGDKVYEGMVVGEHTRKNDINVNAVKAKHVSSVRTAGKDENIILPPVPEMTLDFALDWIDNDEWVEATPEKIRIRKKNLEANKRSVIRE
ncbi:MAG: translational GTPase TypA [Bacteriovoracaceae bacterium]